MHGEVEQVEQLSAQLIRVHFGGAGLDDFVDANQADSYVNLQFPPTSAPYAVPFDPTAVRELPRELQPAARRYTVRAWDPTAKRLSIDFVVHGDEGVAGRWAQATKPGDLLQFLGPGGGYTPSADTDWTLLVGDESALPAIMVSAERVPSTRTVLAVVEVEDAAGEVAFDSPGQLTITWVHREGGHDTDLLLRATQALELPPGRGDAFVHGEAVATRAVRRYLLEQRLVAIEDLSCSPYWRYGYTDEQWRSIKRDWQREVDADVPH